MRWTKSEIFSSLESIYARGMIMFRKMLQMICFGLVLLGWHQAHASETLVATVPVLDYSERYISVIKQVPQEECREVAVRKSGSTSSNTPELLGAIVGGSLANELDDSKTSKLAGALLGASIGSDIEKNYQKNKGATTRQLRCETVYRQTEVREPAGYNVSYSYKGNSYRSVVNRRPGSTIDVRVSVQPVQYSGQSVSATVPVLSIVESYREVVKNVPTEECREVAVRKSGSTSSNTPELLGAIVGGSLANELDDSKTSKLAGALLGASIGSDIEKNYQKNKGATTRQLRCETVYQETPVREFNGYNVSYEYAGEVYTAKMQSRPGSRLDVEVRVVPVDAVA